MAGSLSFTNRRSKRLIICGPSDRREIRATLLRLVEDPWQIPDAEIRPPNDRIYLVKNVRSLRVVYWLDAFAREVYIVRVDCQK